MPKFLTALLVPLALLAPNAAAHGCPDHDTSYFVAAVGLHLAPGGELYQESNGVAGLQKQAGTCEDENGRTHTWAADTRLA